MLIVKLLIYIFVGMFISSLVHELGHLLVALAHKWEFSLLIVGPLRIERNQVTKKVKAKFESNIIFWGGVAFAMPNHEIEAENSFRIWKYVLISGPIFSLLMSGVFFLLFQFYNNVIILILMAQSLGIGMITILPVPIQSGLMYSDGYRFFRIINNGNVRLEEQALFKYSLQIYNSINLDTELIVKIFQPLLLSKNYNYKHYACYLIYEVALKENNGYECDKYKKIMNNISDKVSKSILIKLDYSSLQSE